MPAMMIGMAYVTVPFNNRQSWQNSGESGPYQTRNKSNPLTTDEYVACWNYLLTWVVNDRSVQVFETYQEIATRHQLIDCSPKACSITIHFINYKTVLDERSAKSY